MPTPGSTGREAGHRGSKDPRGYALKLGSVASPRRGRKAPYSPKVAEDVGVRTLTRHLTILAIAGAVLGASCSTSTTAGSTSSVATESTIGQAASTGQEAGVDRSAAEQELEQLPTAFSQLRVAGSVGLYLAVVDGQMLTIGADLTTGQERYRVDTHPVGRLRGVTPTLAIDERSGVFFVTGIELVGDDGYAYLASNSIETGLETWRSEVPATVGQPFMCSQTEVCVRADSEQLAYSIEDGSLKRSSPVTNRRIIASTDDGFIATVGPATTPDDNLDFLAGSDDFGFTESWRVGGDSILELTGSPSTPMAGWAATHASVGTATAMLLGPAGSAATASVFGFDRTSGELLWGSTGWQDCSFGESETDTLVLCPVDPSDPFATNEIVGLDPSTGIELWSIEFDSTVRLDTFEVVLGAQNIYLWGVNDQLTAYDLTTGIEQPAGSAVPCGIGGGFVAIDWPWIDESITYRAVRHVTLCGPSGVPLPEKELLRAWPDSDQPGTPLIAFNTEAAPRLVPTSN